MRLFALLLVLSLSSTAVGQNQEMKYQLRDAVKNYISERDSSVHFAMLSEISKNDIRIAVLWPCIINGAFIDDDIIGLVYKKESNEWIFKEEIGAFRGDGKEQITKALGGDDFTITKPNGLEIDSLPSYIYKKAKEIKYALKQKKDVDIVNLIESYSRAFSLNICGYNDHFAELVIREVFVEKPIKFSNIEVIQDKAVAEIRFQMSGDIQHGKVNLVKIGTGWTIDKLK